MKRVVATILVGSLCALPSLAAAQEFFWRGERGELVPDSDARKSERGFGGWLFITSDPDWEAKWVVPDEVAIPALNEAATLRVGDTVMALIFIANPARSSEGEVNVRCDFRVTRPDGSVSVDAQDLTCLEGPLAGDPLNVRLGAPKVQFVGEPGDARGTWIFEVTLHDAERGSALSLRSSIELLSDG